MKKFSVWAGSALIGLLGFIIVIMFTSLTTGWAVDAYDEWRLWQMPVFMALLGVLWPRDGLYGLFKLPEKRQWAYVALAILLIVNIALRDHRAKLVAEASTYCLLGLLVYALRGLHGNKYFGYLMHALAFLPVVTLVWLPVSVLTALASHTVLPNGAWQLGFTNLRYLDDALLAALLVLWGLRAAKRLHARWLAAPATVLYVCALWLDGARGGLLALLVALLWAGIENYWRARSIRASGSLKALGWSTLGVMLGAMIEHTTSATSLSLTRSTTSGRLDLWQDAMSLWLAHPLLGSSRGMETGYVYHIYETVLHPHNFALQMLAEWGLLGVIVLMALIMAFIRLCRNRKDHPVWTLPTVAALGVNALLSGALVYPHTQLLYALTLGWVLVPQHSSFPAKNNTFRWYLGVCAMLALMTVHRQDYFQYGGTSQMRESEHGVPRFWQFGRNLHLIPVKDKIMDKTQQP